MRRLSQGARRDRLTLVGGTEHSPTTGGKQSAKDEELKEGHQQPAAEEMVDEMNPLDKVIDVGLTVI
jgi:hypothetical protein